MMAQGTRLNAGDIVDVSSWRHVKALESNRYIKILDVKPSVIAKAVEEKVEEPKAEASLVEAKPKAKKDKVAE